MTDKEGITHSSLQDGHHGSFMLLLKFQSLDLKRKSVSKRKNVATFTGSLLALKQQHCVVLKPINDDFKGFFNKSFTGIREAEKTQRPQLTWCRTA